MIFSVRDFWWIWDETRVDGLVKYVYARTRSVPIIGRETTLVRQPRAQKIKITLPIILLVLAPILMHIRLAHREYHGVHSMIQCTRSTYNCADHVLSTQASLKILQGSSRLRSKAGYTRFLTTYLSSS
jgi:hypothetical protein